MQRVTFEEAAKVLQKLQGDLEFRVPLAKEFYSKTGWTLHEYRCEKVRRLTKKTS